MFSNALQRLSDLYSLGSSIWSEIEIDVRSKKEKYGISQLMRALIMNLSHKVPWPRFKNHMYAQVTVDVPDMKGRSEILKVHAKNKSLAEEVDLETIAARTPGFSGADLANLLNEVCV